MTRTAQDDIVREWVERLRNEKYVVIKRDDFLSLFELYGVGPETCKRINEVIEEGWVEDGVVIRRQDAFAPPALDAYANIMTSLIDILKKSPDLDQQIKAVNLQKIATYFHEEATLSWETDRKLPD